MASLHNATQGSSPDASTNGATPVLLDPDDPDVDAPCSTPDPETGRSCGGFNHEACNPPAEPPAPSYEALAMIAREEAYEDYANGLWAALTEVGLNNQLDIAGAFVELYEGNGAFTEAPEFRYDRHRGRWMEFTARGAFAGRWTRAEGILNALGRMIGRLTEDKPSVSAKWGKLSVYRDVLTLAAERLTIDEWDADGGVMGLPNGDVWKLDAGSSQPNYRRLPITKMTGVDPAEFQGAGCEDGCSCLWHNFLADVTGGDAEMEEHLQLSIGAALYGGNRDHRLNVVVGDGGTGKSVFLNAVAKALGDYAGAMPPSVLASRGNDHPTGLAGVVDKRFVVVPEVTGGMWKEETLKTITGGDAIPVRYMRQDFFVAQPECTLWVSTNEPPALRMVDDAIRRRLRIWPFTHKPPEVDPRLGAELQEPDMMGRVLQWALAGAATYATLPGELPDCDAVKGATREYFSDVDTIGAWLAACAEPAHLQEQDTGATAAYKHYEAWCEAEGQRPSGRRSWGVSMGRRVDKRHTKRGAAYAITLDGDG